VATPAGSQDSLPASSAPRKTATGAAKPVNGDVAAAKPPAAKATAAVVASDGSVKRFQRSLTDHREKYKPLIDKAVAYCGLAPADDYRKCKADLGPILKSLQDCKREYQKLKVRIKQVTDETSQGSTTEIASIDSDVDLVAALMEFYQQTVQDPQIVMDWIQTYNKVSSELGIEMGLGFISQLYVNKLELNRQFQKVLGGIAEMCNLCVQFVEIFNGWEWEWGGAVVSGMCGKTTLLNNKNISARCPSWLPSPRTTGP